jgi:putative ABC transport system substrate-binding protein
LRNLGYVYGEQFVTEARGAAGRSERFPGLAGELVRLKVDVIVAAGTALRALKQATAPVPIPIVMVAANDPVGGGYVQSLAHPGGNFTGFSAQWLETTGKRLELLKELVPGSAPVAVIWDRANLPDFQAAEAAARERRWKVLSLEIREIGEIDTAFKAATNAQAGSVLLISGLLFAHAQQVVDLAARSRLPAIYGLAEYVEAGGPCLTAQTSTTSAAGGRLVAILKGAKPADLPVEQPTKFELVINLKIARTLSRSRSRYCCDQADSVITRRSVLLAGGIGSSSRIGSAMRRPATIVGMVSHVGSRDHPSARGAHAGNAGSGWREGKECRVSIRLRR